MRGRDLTRGSIAGGIVLFALPLLGTSVVQQLYATVDLLFVGNVLGTSYTAALGVGSLLITLLVGVFIGISVGVNVKVATLLGAGDDAGLLRALRTALWLSVMCGVACVPVGEALAACFIDAMELPASSADAALSYLRFAVAAAFPIAVYNICAGALRGLGDSSSPLIAQAIGGCMNIIANWFALCVLGAGIQGCACATFVSNGLAAAIVAIVLIRSKAFGRAMRPWIALDSGIARWVLAFGAPVALQTVAITLSNVAVQHQVDLFGVDSIAAFTVYLKVELPIYFVILAIGQATTTFVAQNHGAGGDDRCRRGIRICQALCLALTVSLSITMLAVAPWAFWFFDRSEGVIAIGVAFAQITFPWYFFYAVLEAQADTMRGYGHSLGPALVVLANICLLRVAIVFAAGAHGFGMDAIAASYPITWCTTAVCLVLLRVAFIRGRRREAADRI